MVGEGAAGVQWVEAKAAPNVLQDTELPTRRVIWPQKSAVLRSGNPAVVQPTLTHTGTTSLGDSALVPDGCTLNNLATAP